MTFKVILCWAQPLPAIVKVHNKEVALQKRFFIVEAENKKLVLAALAGTDHKIISNINNIVEYDSPRVFR